jgi:hypothetical protein
MINVTTTLTTCEFVTCLRKLLSRADEVYIWENANLMKLYYTSEKAVQRDSDLGVRNRYSLIYVFLE